MRGCMGTNMKFKLPGKLRYRKYRAGRWNMIRIWKLCRPPNPRQCAQVKPSNRTTRHATLLTTIKRTSRVVGQGLGTGETVPSDIHSADARARARLPTGADRPASALDRSLSPPAASPSAGESTEKPKSPPPRPPQSRSGLHGHRFRLH